MFKQDVAREFINAAKCGNAEKLQEISKTGFSVNYQDPKTGQTALHITAAYNGRKSLDVLLDTNKCDFLLRDNQGRLASELAFMIADDVETAERLRLKERQQADAQGIKLTRRQTIG